MKLSIITATYNSGRTIKDTMNSVLSQSYTDYEHIIIDGGSTDDTLDIIRELEPEYKGKLIYVSGPDHGIYDAMNKGLALASGDVVGVLNSDDFFADRNVLSTIVNNIDRVDAVYGDLDFVDCKDSKKIVRLWRGSQFEPGAFMKGWHPAHPTFYARKECYDQFGGFDITYDVSADFELMLRFLEKGKITSRYVAETFVKMRTGGESTGSILRIIKGNKNAIRAFRKNGFKVPCFYIFRRLLPKALSMLKFKLRLTSA